MLVRTQNDCKLESYSRKIIEIDKNMEYDYDYYKLKSLHFIYKGYEFLQNWDIYVPASMKGLNNFP